MLANSILSSIIPKTERDRRMVCYMNSLRSQYSMKSLTDSLTALARLSMRFLNPEAYRSRKQAYLPFIRYAVYPSELGLAPASILDGATPASSPFSKS